LKWLCAVLGVASAAVSVYIFFVSPLSITAGDLLNGDALAAPFTLTNTGNISIRDIAASCYLKKVRYLEGMTLGDNTVVDYTPKSPRLEVGEQDTAYCAGDKLVSDFGPTVYADVTVMVTYRTTWLPFIPKKKSARFITTKDSNGKIKWIPYGLMDRDPSFK
jgi:hypothetical protein